MGTRLVRPTKMRPLPSRIAHRYPLEFRPDSLLSSANDFAHTSKLHGAR